MQIKIIQEKYKKVDGVPKVFGLISLFASMSMSVTNYILPDTAIFSYKLFHHEERAKSSPDNLPNFTNLLDSNIEVGNDTSTFNEATSQPDRLYFVNSMRK